MAGRVTTGWVVRVLAPHLTDKRYLRIVPMPTGWRSNGKPYDVTWTKGLSGAVIYRSKKEAIAKTSEIEPPSGGEFRPVRLYRKVRGVR